MLFGRDVRTQQDEVATYLDEPGFGRVLERTVAEKRWICREIRTTLVPRQTNENRQREGINEGIARATLGAKAKFGDKILVQEAVSTLHSDVLHP